MTGADDESLAPVSYLPWAGPEGVPPGNEAPMPEPSVPELSVDELVREAENRLLSSLRRRSSSVEEAYSALRESVDDEEAVEEVVGRFLRFGYLDDQRLADEIVRSHHERKGLGRSLVERELSRRGIDPAIVREAVAALPGDETAAAADLARQRVSSVRRLAPEVAERRLMAFLQRKGYGFQTARSAVSTVLAEDAAR